MTPEQIILALCIQLAETTAERDAARNEVARLRAAPTEVVPSTS